MRVQHNIPGMRGLRYGRQVNSETSKVLEKLSSGYRINRASDDAAGLAVSERIRACLTGYGRCEDNVREGIDLAATADAALQEVNDMLCRAEELCVAAANGTYTDHERTQLKEELDALYDEMDRIFTSSRFNKVQLFCHEDGDYSNGEFEYIEEVIETAPDDLKAWGTMDNIADRKEFEFASEAESASVTLTLDSDVSTPQDMIGKEFQVKARSGYPCYTVKFVSGTASGGTYSSNLSIGVDDCATVQEVFDKLCRATRTSTHWNDYNLVLDEENTRVNGNSVTLTFAKTTLSDSVEFPNGDPSINYEIPEGNGAVGNGVEIISREDGSLAPIDSGSNDFTAMMSVTLYPGREDSYVLTEEDKVLLQSTNVNMAGRWLYFKNGLSSGSYIDLDRLTTAKDLRDAVVDKANGLFASEGTDCVLSPAAADGTVTITYKNYPSGKWVYDSVSSPSETVTTGTLDGIQVQVVQNTSAEGYEITKVTLPSLTAMSGDHFTLKIGTGTYHFYDQNDLKPGFVGSGTDISNMTEAQVYSEIRSRIAAVYGSEATVTLDGNEITLTAKTINKALDISVRSEAGTMHSYLPGQVSDTLISGYHYFEDYSFTWDIADATGNDEGNIFRLALDGNCVGFRLNGTLYQFANDPSDAVSTEAKLIDISSCRTYDEVAAQLQASISGTSVTVSDGKIVVTGSYANTSSGALSFEDGLVGQDGLFNENVGTVHSAVSSGGTKTGYSYATVDFTDYNAENFRELYGKGFQVTCATCEGEYINVIFCYDKAQCEFPDSFEKWDDSSGEMRTIHNLVVELKGMSSGSDIVDSIVTQLQPNLNHYTGVERGTPASVLRVYDRRLGNQYGPGGEPLRAEIRSGVLTNCIYTVKENFYPAPDDVVGDIEIDYRQVRIYADAESVDHYIDIHLPYLTLKNLKLNPPEPDLSTPEKALATVERVLNATNAISSMRGVLGADYNRLEHAAANLSQTAEQAADAYSRIRDADMADMMTERVRLSILQQAQQAAQAHTLKMPEQILSILRS